MMIRERKRSCKRRYVDESPRPSSKPINFYAEKGIRPFAPGQPKLEEETYTSEQDFIEKRTKLIRQFRRPVFVTGIGGRRARLHMPVRTVTSASWKIYQQQQKQSEEFHRLFEKSCIDSPVSSSDNLSDSESLPYDVVDASAAGLNHPLLEEKPELEALSSTPLDALDVTGNTNTVTEPVVEGLPCDPLDIPAAGLSNTLLDAQVPGNTPAPVTDLVAESLLGDKHDGEDESLGTAAKKKAHQKMHDKKKRKSIVLSPGRLSMKKMKMGRHLDDISQDKKLVALVKKVIKEELSSMKKELKTLKKKLKSYDQVQTRKAITSSSRINLKLTESR